MSGSRLVHVFSTFAAGGPQVRTTDLVNAMPGEHAHVFVAMDRQWQARERLDPRADCRFVDPPALPGGLGNVVVLRRFLASLEPDLVLTYNWGAIESAPAVRGLRGVRHVHAEDGFGPEEAHRLLARRNWARRAWLRSASAVVVPSRRLERIARRTWWLGDRVRYVPNGVDTERFQPGDRDEARRRLGREETGPVIGTVAKLRAEKRLELLLAAFAELHHERPALRLWIAGDGPERSALEGEAERLGLGEAVWFAGRVEDPAGFHRALDVFALSSSTEQMPLSVTEAMASERLVVATAVGDVEDMLGPDGASFLVRSDDPRDLASALARGLDSPDRARIAAGLRQRCLERYSFSRMLAEYRELYTPRPSRSA